MKFNSKHLAVLGFSAALVAGYVGAQTGSTPSQTSQTQPADLAQQGFGKGFRGHGGRHGGGGFGGFGFRHVALDTKLTFSFYDADPATGAAPTETLEFTYGVDSEAAFAEAFQSARAAATFMKVDIGEQSRTVDLSTVDTSRGLLPRELSGHAGLNDGSTLTATFYNADPESGGTVLQTLTYTQGSSSEAGFADDFATAAAAAAFVTITTSPQSNTIDLSAIPQPGQGFGPDMNRQGFGPRPGGNHMHRQGFGPGNGMNHGNNLPADPVPPADPDNSTPAIPDGDSQNS
jgi:hypothetical protein